MRDKEALNMYRYEKIIVYIALGCLKKLTNKGAYKLTYIIVKMKNSKEGG